jgi:hypothetical protein
MDACRADSLKHMPSYSVSRRSSMSGLISSGNITSDSAVVQAAAREAHDAPYLTDSAPPGCLAASGNNQNQNTGGATLPSADDAPGLGVLKTAASSNGRNGSGSTPLGAALPHTSPLHAVSPTAASVELSGGDGNDSGSVGA